MWGLATSYRNDRIFPLGVAGRRRAHAAHRLGIAAAGDGVAGARWRNGFFL
jgi:hypothetical protein